jgi:hypothetical protein
MFLLGEFCDIITFSGEEVTAIADEDNIDAIYAY